MDSKYNSFVTSKNYDISNRKRTPLSSEASKIKDSPHSLGNSTFQPTTYFQSTPKGKSSITNPVTLMNGSLPRSPSSPGQRSVSPVHQRSTSPTKLHLSGGSISPRQLLDVDTDTIQKQRRELQLLIMELKDRDRELNDMVQTHQKHLHAWDEDRQRILALERRCARLEGELKSRNEQCKALTARLKSSEAEEITKRKELDTTMDRLKEISEQADVATQQVDELEDKNTSLSDSLRELSNNCGQLQAKEQELLTKLILKENDITEANIHLGEFQQKIRRLESALQEYQTLEKALRAERDQFRDQLNATKNEVENLRGEMTKQFSDADDLQSELAQSKQEILVLQKEVFLAGEREKRKEQLLELQKSKQERTDSELQNIRQICERQQRDISYMQMHLQSTQDAFLKTETQTKDERDFESSQVNTHPQWLNNMSSESMGTINGSLGPLSRPLNTSNTSSHVASLTLLSAQTAPGGDIVRGFTGLSLAGDMEYGFNGPVSYFSDAKPPPSARRQENILDEESLNNPDSPVLTSDSEHFFQLPSRSTFSIPNYMEKVGTTSAHSSNNDPSSITHQRQEEEGSPTSKLHRLLAESREMVQNLEHSTIKISPPGGLIDGSSKFSPSTQSTSNPNIDRPSSC